MVEKLDENHYAIVRVCLVEGNQFATDVKERNVCFSLIPRKTEKQNELENASANESFMVKFQDIISNNVPNGLPPMISISHCIQLICGSSFPNNLPYRLICVENDDVNRQVQEFLE